MLSLFAYQMSTEKVGFPKSDLFPLLHLLVPFFNSHSLFHLLKKTPAVGWRLHYLSRYNWTSRGHWTNVAQEDTRLNGIKCLNPCWYPVQQWLKNISNTSYCPPTRVPYSPIPFVLCVYLGPKGIGSLFTTHPNTVPQEEFGEHCPAWLIACEVDHTNNSWRGTHSYFTPDLYVFVADRSLLTRGGGWGGEGGGIWSTLKWKPKRTCVQTSLSSLFSLPSVSGSMWRSV